MRPSVRPYVRPYGLIKTERVRPYVRPYGSDLKCKKRIKGKIRLGERWVRSCNMWDRVKVGGMVVKAD